MKKILSIFLCAVLLAGIIPAVPISAEDYVFNELDSCTYYIVAGDANGDGKVSLIDASRIIKYVVGEDVKVPKYESDVNVDEVVNLKDAARLIRYLAGWTTFRLCHKDTTEVTQEASETEYGRGKFCCEICGSVEEYLIPKIGQTETFKIKGVPLSEYTIVYGECPGQESLKELAIMLSNALTQIAGVTLDYESAEKGVNEHEIVLGACDREILPEFDTNTPVSGVCEDGTVYFYAYTLSMTRYLVDSFMMEAFGGPFGATTLRKNILRNPYGESMDDWVFEVPELDLEAEGYELVFADEFEGTELNTDNWIYRGSGLRRDGVNDPAMVSVENGNLIIRGKYVEGGTYGDKWHGGMIALSENYSRGYFEIRAKCADSTFGFWSAFWIQGTGPYNAETSQGGIGPGGAELDILENNCAKGKIRHNIYCAGTSGIADLKDYGYNSYNSDEYYIGDITGEYHTYALEWDEDWYTFYVDGIMVGRTNYGDGTALSPEQVILSLEIGANMIYPGEPDFEETKDKVAEYVVDYIRIWQK